MPEVEPDGLGFCVDDLLLHRRWLGFVATLLVGTSLAATSMAEVPRRVLVVHSFGREFAPFDAMSSAFRTELARRSAEPLEFSEVAIETARFAGAGDDRPLVEYLRNLYSARPLDLMITVAEPATQFVVRNREVLFPNVPWIAHVDHRQAEVVRASTNTTLVPVHVRLPVLVGNILEVLPATTNIVFVLGASPFERYWTTLCRQELARYEGRVAIQYLNDLPLDRMCDHVASLPPRSAVLYAMLAIDAAGVPYEQEKALTRLRAASAAPVFGVFESQLGHGIVGGALLSLEDSGNRAARVALRLLRGEASRVPEEPESEPTRHRYDWRELERWRIDERRLPAGSEVLYRPPSSWEEHRGPILAGVAVILAQVVTIGG
ncbi:MAG: hypothetical protein JNL97_02740, partial [Verrucomicrobiales bacterium]|nr:hypothetical protein [Verrucomicrobiales bacterium]